MRFEEQVTLLCAQALAVDDDVQVRQILAELRLVLHQHIEELRSGLLAAYSTTVASSGAGPKRAAEKEIADGVRSVREKPARTWQQLVQDIVRVTDHGKARQLSQELAALLQRHAETQSH